MRRDGKSSIVIHHEGKGGTQRGTSKREDILDTSIHLKLPADYSPSEGARFEVHFEKCRAIVGETTQPFEVRLDASNGRANWIIRDIENVKLVRAAELFRLRMSVREVAEELKISKSSAQEAM